MVLELKKALSGTGARVHEGKEPPPEGAPSSIVLCPKVEDVASEVGKLRTIGAPILVVGSCSEPQTARAALRAGACGFVDLRAPPGHFLQALSLISKGEIVISKEILVDLLGDNLFLVLPRLLRSPSKSS